MDSTIVIIVVVVIISITLFVGSFVFIGKNMPKREIKLSNFKHGVGMLNI